MISLALAALVLLGADELSGSKVNGLELKLPADWRKQAQKDGSLRYDAPSGDGWLELAVYKVEPRREAKLCLEQLLQALGKEGWVPLRVGAAPAAQRSSSERGEDEQGEISVEAWSTTYLGCNGSTKWVLTVAMNEKSKGRFEKVAGKILESIRYSK